MLKNKSFYRELVEKINLDELRHREYIEKLCERSKKGEIDLLELSVRDLEDMCSCLEEKVKRKEAILNALRNED